MSSMHQIVELPSVFSAYFVVWNLCKFPPPRGHQCLPNFFQNVQLLFKHPIYY